MRNPGTGGGALIAPLSYGLGRGQVSGLTPALILAAGWNAGVGPRARRECRGQVADL